VASTLLAAPIVNVAAENRPDRLGIGGGLHITDLKVGLDIPTTSSKTNSTVFRCT
jgi:hypothetical protein